MEVHAKQHFDNLKSIRFLILTGLVGLSLAVSGFIWLTIGNAKFEYQLAQRAALYSSSWSLPEQCLSCYITRFDISRHQLTLTIHAIGNLSHCIECDLGTGSVTFAGEPFTVTIPNNSSASIFTVTMTLNNAENTQLKVTYNFSGNNDTNSDTFTAIYDKKGP